MLDDPDQQKDGVACKEDYFRQLQRVDIINR